ncbi:MAG: MFS transporter, partial [Mycobacteriales bacterium]
PMSGRLTDRFGARPFATAGIALSGVCFLLFDVMPMNFSYIWFALLLLVMGLSLGLFFAPNIASVMNSLPADQRGAGAGMLNTFQNSAQVLSIGVFFTVITLGLAARLPQTLQHGLSAQGMPAAQAHTIAHLPPIGTLFAAFLGYNPIQQLIGSPAAAHVSAAHYHYLTGRSFFPHLITGPFGHGLHLAFLMAAAVSFIGAICSALRGADTVEAAGKTRRTRGEAIEAGLAGAGDAAMAEVGAGVGIED